MNKQTYGKDHLVEQTATAQLGFFGPDGTVVNTDTNFHETTSYAVFGQATWNITDDFPAAG